MSVRPVTGNLSSALRATYVYVVIWSQRQEQELFMKKSGILFLALAFLSTTFVSTAVALPIFAQAGGAPGADQGGNTDKSDQKKKQKKRKRRKKKA